MAAQIGFVVACAAELAAPAQGFFGAWTPRDASVFSALALALVCSAALLATQNKRQLGFRMREVRATASLCVISHPRPRLVSPELTLGGWHDRHHQVGTQCMTICIEVFYNLADANIDLCRYPLLSNTP